MRVPQMAAVARALGLGNPHLSGLALCLHLHTSSDEGLFPQAQSVAFRKPFPTLSQFSTSYAPWPSITSIPYSRAAPLDKNPDVCPEYSDTPWVGLCHLLPVSGLSGHGTRLQMPECGLETESQVRV